MGHNSLQVCMDSSSDWIQGSVHDDQSPMDSSSPLSGDILTCSRPLIERRLRPPHDQSLKCPRCDSTHTKFCYYNNYSLSQPRYFCKTCRRYWTKGGTLRNIPVGGGCRKNKKVSNSKKSNEDHNASMNPNHLGSSSSSSAHNPTDLQLSFPDHQMQFSHLNNLMLGGQGTGSNPSSFMDGRYGSINGLLENSNPLRPIDFMESKLEAIVGNARNYDFMGADNLGIVGGLGNMGGAHGLDTGYHGFCSSPFGSMSLDHHGNNNGSANFMDTCQRLMLPYETNEDHRHHNHHHHQNVEIHDVKPNTKLLSLEWQDQGCADAGKDSSFAYLNGMGSWTGVMNNYSPSATNSLV